MRTTHTRVMNTVQAVQGFIDKYAGQLGNVATSNARGRLDEVARKLADHSATQNDRTSAATAATAIRVAARDALIKLHLKPIVDAAKAEVDADPVMKTIRMPRLSVSDTALVEATKGIANELATRESTFIAAGLPSDFLAQLRQAATDLSEASAARAVAVRERVGAVNGLQAECRAAIRRIRVLNNSIRPHVKSAPALASSWKQAMTLLRKSASTSVTIADDSSDGTAPSGATGSTTTPTQEAA